MFSFKPLKINRSRFKSISSEYQLFSQQEIVDTFATVSNQSFNHPWLSPEVYSILGLWNV